MPISNKSLASLEVDVIRAYEQEIDRISNSDIYELYLKPLSSIFPVITGRVLIVGRELETHDEHEFRAQTGLNSECLKLTQNNSDIYSEIVEQLSNYEGGSFEAIVLLDCFSRMANAESEETIIHISRLLTESGICICSIANPEYFFKKGIHTPGVAPLSYEHSNNLFICSDFEKCKYIGDIKYRNEKINLEATYVLIGKKNGPVDLDILSYDDIFSSSIKSEENGIVKNLQCEVERLSKEIAKCNQERSRLISSISWRITAPFRLATRNALQVKQKIDKIIAKKTSRIYIDISQLVHIDSRTGIQRVVWNIIRNWGKDPALARRIKLIYAYKHESHYRHAIEFVEEQLGGSFITNSEIDDEIVEFQAGDVFLGLDFQPDVVESKSSLLKSIKESGVNTVFILYDILPIRFPEYFPKTTRQFKKWLEVVSSATQVICISEAVKNDYQEWLHNNSHATNYSPDVNYFTLGSDAVEQSGGNTKGLSTQHNRFLTDTLQARKTFLMVGTLEPRKAHEQVMNAIELLWQNGEDINLVIVGKKGWMSEELARRILLHVEFGHRLFWLEGVSDMFLASLYSSSSALIAASYGEGVGLPLVEAAQNSLPVIARDIPVFREVAGEGAYYFMDDMSANTVATTISEWISLYDSGMHPNPSLFPIVTWADSAKELINIVTG